MAVDQLRLSTSSRADSTTTSSIHRAIETKDILLKTKICMMKRGIDKF